MLMLRVFLSVIIMVAVLAIACDKNPTSSEIEPTEYPVYFNDVSGSNNIFRYFPETKQIDTINITPYEPSRGITLTADGKGLMVNKINSIIVLDADSFRFVDEINIKPVGNVSVSKDNNFIAIISDSLVILNRNDYSVYYTSQRKGFYCKFSPDSKYLFLTTSADDVEPYEMIRINIDNPSTPLWSKTFEPDRVIRFDISPSNNSIYMYMSLYPNIQVYDIGLDSVTFTYNRTPSRGNLVLTNDGKKLFYTAPGDVTNWIPPVIIFGIFDTQIMQVIKEYPHDMFVDSTNMMGFYGHNMVVTPDDNYLLLSDKASPWQILVYDIVDDEISDYLQFTQISIGNLTVQK